MKNEKYFVNLAAKKLFNEISRKKGGLYGELIFVAGKFPTLIFADDERELNEDTATIGPRFYAVPRTARALRKEVKYIRRGHC